MEEGRTGIRTSYKVLGISRCRRYNNCLPQGSLSFARHVLEAVSDDGPLISWMPVCVIAGSIGPWSGPPDGSSPEPIMNIRHCPAPSQLSLGASTGDGAVQGRVIRV